MYDSCVLCVVYSSFLADVWLQRAEIEIGGSRRRRWWKGDEVKGTPVKVLMVLNK